MAIHPSFMVGSDFTKNLPKMKLWRQLAAIGQTPQKVADNLFRSISLGLTWSDSGVYAVAQRLMSKLLDMNVWVPLVGYGVGLNEDTRRMMFEEPRRRANGIVRN
ncbi:MAG: hypothetical protein R3C68_08075 [Myxococcota bacterium]